MKNWATEALNQWKKDELGGASVADPMQYKEFQSGAAQQKMSRADFISGQTPTFGAGRGGGGGGYRSQIAQVAGGNNALLALVQQALRGISPMNLASINTGINLRTKYITQSSSPKIT